MASRGVDIRLTGKELFVYYYKGMGEGSNVQVGGCTNKRILSKKTGIEYNTLMWVFTRKGRCYYETSEVVIMKLFVRNIIKGNQSIVRRGRGGMERFRERYMMNRREY